EFYNFLIDSDQGRGFKGDVIRQLDKADRGLGERLKVIERENADFRQAREYRNSIVHQVFPGDSSIEMVRSKWNGKIHTEFKSAVLPEEFMNNIAAIIKLIANTLEMLQREFDDYRSESHLRTDCK
ncbi:MAG TPA: Cthe_2314 family HEPN domain-containing protein, partial [Desulfobacteria bacterium]|nr:Cthe_2314 family HEPN domain-containing protein [Desulfobacteria bacterium]